MGSHLEMAAQEGKPSPGGHSGRGRRELPPLSQSGSLLISISVLGIVAWDGFDAGKLGRRSYWVAWEGLGVSFHLPTADPTCPPSLTL